MPGTLFLISGKLLYFPCLTLKWALCLCQVLFLFEEIVTRGCTDKKQSSLSLVLLGQSPWSFLVHTPKYFQTQFSHFEMPFGISLLFFICRCCFVYLCDCSIHVRSGSTLFPQVNCFVFLRQDLMNPRLAQNFLHSQEWPWTPDLLPPTSPLLGLQSFATMPGNKMFSDTPGRLRFVPFHFLSISEQHLAHVQIHKTYLPTLHHALWDVVVRRSPGLNDYGVIFK